MEALSLLGISNLDSLEGSHSIFAKIWETIPDGEYKAIHCRFLFDILTKVYEDNLDLLHDDLLKLLIIWENCEQNQDLLSWLPSRYKRIGELQLAEEKCEHYLQISPDEPSLVVLLANIYKDRKQYDQAKNLLVHAWHVYPENQKLLVELAFVLVLQRQYAEAYDYLQQLFELNPSNWEYRLLELDLLCSAEQSDLLLEKVAEMEADGAPKSAKVDIYKAWALLEEEKDPEVAYELCDSILKNESNFELASFAKETLARACIRIEQYQRAEELLTSLLENDPDTYHYALRASVYKNTGRYKLAIADYLSALKIVPNYMYALYSLGVLYYNLDKMSLAFLVFEQIINYDPNYYPLTWYYLLKSYSKISDFKALLRYAKKLTANFDIDSADNYDARMYIVLAISDACYGFEHFSDGYNLTKYFLQNWETDSAGIATKTLIDWIAASADATDDVAFLACATDIATSGEIIQETKCDDLDFMLRHADFCYELGLDDEAASWFDKILAIDSPGYNGLDSSARFYLITQNDYSAAIDRYKQLLEINQEDRHAHQKLGVMYTKTEDANNARLHFRAGLELLIVDLNEYIRAVDATDDSYTDITIVDDADMITLSSDAWQLCSNPCILHEVAICLHGLGNTATAKAMLQQACEIAPDYEGCVDKSCYEAYFKMAEILKDEGDIAGARECYNKTIATTTSREYREAAHEFL